jgi:hypothetical protein
LVKSKSKKNKFLINLFCSMQISAMVILYLKKRYCFRTSIITELIEKSRDLHQNQETIF